VAAAGETGSSGKASDFLFRMYLVRISAATPIILTQVFLGSPQFFQANIITVFQTGADLSSRTVEGTKYLLPR
jgi:hypothetical protein